MRRFWFIFTFLLLVASHFGSGEVVAGYQVGPELGSPVAIVGQDGTEVARITVSDVVDPFETYDPGYPPERGYRMVLLTLTVEATGAQPFSFNPSYIYLVDDAGYLANSISATVPEDTGVTLLASQDVAPGTPLTGSITLQAFSAATLNSIVYWPQSDRLVPLARLGGASPTVGATVPVMANDGSENAQITVREVLDPFEGYDASSPPERGNHFVLLTVSIQNTGVRPMRVDPNAFQLLDSDGFLTRPSFVSREEGPVADLAYTDPFPPGEALTGVIAYQVLSGTAQTSVLYIPSNDRLIEVAVLGDSPAGGASAGATPIAAETGATSTADVAAESGECAGVDEWSSATVDRFTAAGSITGGIQPLEERVAADAPEIRQAAMDIAALAAEQESGTTPPAAVEFNAMAVTYLTNVSQALDFFAEGLENDDVTQQVVALANLGEIEQTFASGGEANLAYDALLAACPPE
jgi:hypothetical protein